MIDWSIDFKYQGNIKVNGIIKFNLTKVNVNKFVKISFAFSSKVDVFLSSLKSNPDLNTH